MMSQLSDYSAFGSTSPLYDAGGDRIRWFCPWRITGEDTVRALLNALADVRQRFEPSRVTVRVVSEGELPPACVSLLQASGLSIEAKMLTSGARKLTVSYVGSCAAGRRSDEQDVIRERALVEEILAKPRKGPAGIRDAFERLVDYRAQTIAAGDLDAADIERLVHMHQQSFPTFPYDFRRKIDIMRDDPDTYPMVAVRQVSDGQIQAFSNLELNRLKLSDGTRLFLAEFDNTMRMESHLRQGAGGGLGGILRLQLARLAARSGADLCHAESRAGLVAINDVSCQLGMRFGGTLEKHLLISGHSDIDYTSPARFESMNVWYLNHRDLAEINALPEVRQEAGCR